MTEKPPSWLYKRRKMLTEHPLWLSSEKFVSKRGEIVTKQKVWTNFFSRVSGRIVRWNIYALILWALVYFYLPNVPELEKTITDLKGMSSGPWEAFFSVFGIIYAIIVSMVIVEALSSFNNLKSLTEQEVNAVEDIRDFLIYLDDDDEARPEIWASLRTYVNSVIKLEWPGMRNKGVDVDSDTSPELYQLMKDVRKIRTNEGTGRIVLESIINKIAELTTYRTERIERSVVGYTAYQICVLISSLTMVIGGGLILMFVEPWWVHFLMIVTSVSAMATLYGLILDLNHPFGEGDLWEIKDESFKNLAERLGSVEVTCDDFSKQQHITEEFHVSVADWFKVKLRNPSADFPWSEKASISNDKIVQQTYHELLPPVPRTPGQEVWTFKALEKGETSVSMEWSQPGEGGVGTEWTFALKVVVK